MKPLTPRQNAFCAEYLKDLNATKAAIRAGYSAAAAEAIGSRLLSYAKVRRVVDAAIERRAARVEVKVDDVLRELIAMANVDIRQAFRPDGSMLSLHEMPADVARMIQSVETSELFGYAPGEEGKVQIGHVRKVKFWSKEKALELLGKHLKMYTDKVEHQGEVSIKVIDPYSVDPKKEESK